MQNDDRPLSRPVGHRLLSFPLIAKQPVHMIHSGVEVMTSIFHPRSAVVSAIRIKRTRSGVGYTLSNEFSRKCNNVELLKQIKKIAPSVIVVCSYYSDKGNGGNDDLLEASVICSDCEGTVEDYPNISSVFRYAERAVRPKVDANMREKHCLTEEYGGDWQHNSDFALLEIKPQHQIYKHDEYFREEDECEFEPSIQQQLSCSKIEVDDEVFVFGIPNAITEEEFKKEYTDCKFTYAEFIQTFEPGLLHVSFGRVTYVNESVCGYNANAASGMSGGPVFKKTHNNELIPIGIHIGGRIKIDLNFFVPYSMPAFAETVAQFSTGEGVSFF